MKHIFGFKSLFVYAVRRENWRNAAVAYVGLEQEQSAAESALLQSRGGSCIAGARMRGQWRWEEKCGGS